MWAYDGFKVWKCRPRYLAAEHSRHAIARQVGRNNAVVLVPLTLFQPMRPCTALNSHAATTCTQKMTELTASRLLLFSQETVQHIAWLEEALFVSTMHWIYYSRFCSINDTNQTSIILMVCTPIRPSIQVYHSRTGWKAPQRISYPCSTKFSPPLSCSYNSCIGWT